ncbi:unnamed protein product [Rhizopus stolonifer]
MCWIVMDNSTEANVSCSECKLERARKFQRRVVGAKKRKAPEGVAAAIPKGTTVGHFVQFISDTLDIMDEFSNMKVFYIVTDNAPIHPPDVVDPVISQRGYILVYLPPYSPELNPIGMFGKYSRSTAKMRILQKKSTNFKIKFGGFPKKKKNIGCFKLISRIVSNKFHR